MAAQAVFIAETIAGMKKAVARGDDASDSDDSVRQPTNRGNKLKRKARYVHEGQLSLPNGPRVYRRRIEHAGYERYIIGRNPARFDEDGDELDDDDVDEQADANAAEENPYSDIRLEYLLAPLTSAADLPHHPSLSVPYLSNTLTELAQQACQMFHKENASLARIQQIMTKFRGDETWIPCGNLQAENDFALFGSSHLKATKNGVESRVISAERPVGFSEGQPAAEHSIMPGPSGEFYGGEDLDVSMDSSHANSIPLGDDVPPSTKKINSSDNLTTSIEPTKAGDHGESRVNRDDGAASATGARKSGPGSADEQLSETHALSNHTQGFHAGNKLESTEATFSKQKSTQKPEVENPEISSLSCVKTNEEGKIDQDESRHNLEFGVPGAYSDDDMELDADSQPALHRMTTRAQAQAASEKNPSTPALSSPPSSPVVHPLFIVAPDALPDRDFGLPPGEAEDTRRLLLLYVQKQEEICRGAERLYSGLLRADRMRKQVLSWTKAEAHVGEMSDGEDWYDKEEWGLDDDLKKGHGEEEEDSANQGKKTRGRRA